MPGQEFYSEDDAQEILRLAARTPQPGGMSRDQMASVASELGISPEALAAAELEFRNQQQARLEASAEAEQKRLFQRKRVGDFIGHLVTYVSVNAFLIFIWSRSAGSSFWPGYVLGGWGIGVIAQLASLFMPSEFEKEWAAQKIKEDPEKLALAFRMRFRGSLDEVDEFLEELQESGVHGKLDAIKYLREATGYDLKESKQRVELFIGRNPKSFR